MFRVAAGNVTLVEGDDGTLYAQHFLQIVRFQIAHHGSRHSADNQIQPEQFHHLLVNHGIDGRFFLKRFAERGDNLQRNLVGIRKFLKIKRIHFKHIHVPDRNGAHILQVYAQQGAAENIKCATSRLTCREPSA